MEEFAAQRAAGSAYYGTALGATGANFTTGQLESGFHFIIVMSDL